MRGTLAGILAALALMVQAVQASELPDPREFMAASIAESRGQSSYSELTMTITRPDWTGGGQDYVRVMDVVDASLLKTYHVGPGASILAFAQVISRREDINNDGVVNVLDLIIATRFLGDQGAGIIADVNGDEVVNILDLVLIGQGL